MTTTTRRATGGSGLLIGSAPFLLTFLLALGARPAQAAEEPTLSPSNSLWVSAGVTGGLWILGTAGSFAGGVPGVVLFGLSDLTPELGYYANGHWGRGAAMFFLRHAAIAAGVGIGYGVASAAIENEPSVPDDEGDGMLAGLNQFLGLLAGSFLGGGLANALFLIFEWQDTYDTVARDWETYEQARTAEAWVESFNVAPYVLPTETGLAGGVQLAVRF